MKKQLTRLLSVCLIMLLGMSLQAQVTTTVSSIVGAGWEGSNTLDGNTASSWSSNVNATGDNEEWIAFDLNEVITLSKVSLTPRFVGESLNFPIDFEIQSSENGVDWTTIPGQAYTDYATPTTGSPIDFAFAGEGVETQYIRLLATELAGDGGTNHYFQLAEFAYSVYGEVTVSASSTWGIPGMEPASARDNDPATYWACDNSAVQTPRAEWIALDLGMIRTLAKVTLTPRSSGAGFPIDFEIQSSVDGNSWVGITGHTYTGYANPGSTDPIDFVFAAEGVSTQYIRIFASNLADIGGGAYMFHLTQFDFSEVLTVPSSPSEVSAVAGNTEATVSFTASTDDGGSSITGYTVTSNPGSISATGSGSPIIVSGLSNDTEYTFTVTATNAIGESASSDASNAVTPTDVVTVPNPPTAVSAVAGDTEATVSFSAPVSDGGAAITSYTVTSSPGDFSNSGASSPITVTGLSNGTAYTFTVTATNSEGESAASAASDAVTPIGVPGVPTEVVAKRGGNAEAIVSFTAPASDGGAAITSYTLTSSPGGITAIGTASPIAVSSLTVGVEYTFTVVAGNSQGNSEISSASNAVTPVAMVWDERPVSTFNVDYEQDFTTGSATFDQAKLDNQWTQVDAFSADNVANGFLEFFWVERRTMFSKVTYTSPFVIEGKLGYGTSSNRGGMVIRMKTNTGEEVQEPMADPGFNKEGIAFYPSPSGEGLVIQFTAADNSKQEQIIAKVGVGEENLLTTPFEVKVEDYGKSLYVFLDGAPHARIELSDLSEGVYSSGVVYDMNMLTLGEFSGMEIVETGYVAFSERDAAMRLYNAKISTGQSVPDAPTSVSAVAGNTEATVTFTASASDGGSAITSYTVTSSPDGVTASGSASPIIVTGLSNDVEYTFTVTATNGVGNSVASEVSNAVTPENLVTAPNPPTDLSAVAGNAEATVSFTAPENNGGSAITGYKVTSIPGDITANGTESPITLTGLTNGVEYTFTVSAINAIGEGSPSGASNAVTPSTISDAPSTVVAEYFKNDMVKVSFTAPAFNGGSAISSYTVTSTPDGITQNGASSPIIISGLTSATVYTFTVIATNANGDSQESAASNEVTMPGGTSIKDLSSAEVNVYQRNLDIIVDMSELHGRQKVCVIDITGKTIISEEVTGGSEYRIASQMRKGLYIVTIQSEGEVYQNKIVVR